MGYTTMETVGWLGGILLSLCAAPELVKTVRERKCGIGAAMLLLWGVGEILMLIYVLPKLDYPLIFNYALNLTLVGILSWYKWKFG